MPEDNMSTVSTLPELLARQAERYQDKIALSFSRDGEEEQGRLTYQELDIKARRIASSLQQQVRGLVNSTGSFPLELGADGRVAAIAPPASRGVPR